VKLLQKIQEYNIDKHIALQLENRDLLKRNGKVQKLGFIVDENDVVNSELLYDVAQDLNIQRKDIKIVKFVALKKKAPTLIQNQISNKDFSWKGSFTNSDAEVFLDTPFDALIVMSSASNVYIDYLVSRSKAHFKIGFLTTKKKFFDLILAIDPSDVALFKSELKKYLTLLNKI